MLHSFTAAVLLFCAVVYVHFDYRAEKNGNWRTRASETKRNETEKLNVIVHSNGNCKNIRIHTHKCKIW